MDGVSCWTWSKNINQSKWAISLWSSGCSFTALAEYLRVKLICLTVVLAEMCKRRSLHATELHVCSNSCICGPSYTAYLCLGPEGNVIRPAVSHVCTTMWMYIVPLNVCLLQLLLSLCSHVRADVIKWAAVECVCVCLWVCLRANSSFICHSRGESGVNAWLPLLERGYSASVTQSWCTGLLVLVKAGTVTVWSDIMFWCL